MNGLMECQLIVFVKAPRPGTVKTRLAQEIGFEAACAAYCQILQTLFRQLSPLKNVQLWFTPDERMTALVRDS